MLSDLELALERKLQSEIAASEKPLLAALKHLLTGCLHDRNRCAECAVARALLKERGIECH